MEILNEVAKNNNGNFVHIKNALPNLEYFCPECKERFIVKKGDIRQHHFAHKNSSACSGTGEGWLHKTFKLRTLEIIQSNLASKTPIFVNFQCNICNKQHYINLLYSIADAKDEYDLNECRPDISLINQNNAVPIIIEIVDTHEPEKNVFDYCTKNKTTLIRIKLDTINDLENVENKLRNPTNVILFEKSHCPNVKIPPKRKPLKIRVVSPGQYIPTISERLKEQKRNYKDREHKFNSAYKK